MISRAKDDDEHEDESSISEFRLKPSGWADLVRTILAASDGALLPLVARGLSELHRPVLRYRRHRQRGALEVHGNRRLILGPVDPRSAGNGSLMRFGVVLVIGIVLSKFGKLDRRVLVRCSADQSGSRQSIILHGIFWCGGGVTGAVSWLLIRP